MTSGREVDLYQDRKAVAWYAFSAIPMKYLQNFVKKTKKKVYRDRKNGSIACTRCDNIKDAM
jgi:hypothetical protein